MSKQAALQKPAASVRRSPVMVGTKAQLAALEEARLVAEYAAADAAYRAADKARESARTAMMAHIRAAERHTARGAAHLITLKEQVRNSLDTQRIKVEMGEAWCAERSKQAVVASLTITALDG